MYRFVEWFDHYFHCSQRERQGIFSLSFLCILLFIGSWLYQAYVIQPEKIDFSEWEAHLAQFDLRTDSLDLQRKNKYSYKKNYQKESYNADKAEFAFNPNTADQATFLALGLSPKTAQSIINYREKGGQFRRAEDFKKIFTLSAADYERLAPYIRFEKMEKNAESPMPAASESFAFNPNTATAEDLQRLGFSEKTAQSILNYRSKGGQFRTKKDLAKIYGVQETDFLRLQAFIQLPDSLERKSPMATAFPNSKNPKAIIDINTATVDDWTQLRGIGKSTAERIIKFKNSLGGFINTQQIAEIYGFPDSTYQKIKPQIICNQPIIQKININTATEAELKTHPYIKYRHIKAILKYREKQGKFLNLEILQTFPEFDDGEDTYKKLRPYLSH